MTTQAQPDRITELEQEVKSLTRLIKEMAAREKVMQKRLQMVAQDGAQNSKALQAFNTMAQKVDAKLNAVHAQVQRRT